MKPSPTSRSQQRNEIVRAAKALVNLADYQERPSEAEHKAFHDLRAAVFAYEKPTKRRSLPRVSKKEPIRRYENGIKPLPGGREKCMTKEARRRREDEIFERDKRIDVLTDEPYWCCAGCGKASPGRSDFTWDHIIKRSIERDDSLKNAQLLGKPHFCNCHDAKDGGMRQPRQSTKTTRIMT